MPTKAEIRHKIATRKKVIIKFCMTEPRNIEELAKLIGMRPSAVNFYIQDLIGTKELTTYGVKANSKGRDCFSYLATASEYVAPVIVVKPPVIIPYVPAMVKKEVFKPVFEKVNDYTRTVLLTDKVKIPSGAPKRIDGWKGSTFSTMTF